jgi:hypothetical protein
MSHDLIFALCSLALLLGTIWLLSGIARHLHGVMFSGRTLQHLRGQSLNAKPHGAAIEFGVPASSSSSFGGWSRIRRAMRARQSAHVAAR